MKTSRKLQCRALHRIMAFSGQAARMRTAALALSLVLLAAIVFVRPANFVREQIKHPRQTGSSPRVGHSQLVSNYNVRLENCTKNYRSLQRGASSDPGAVTRTGYVLCLTYREQQTRAALSMYSLQCLAKTLLVNIVEPFMHESRLVVPLDASQKTMLAFGDLFSLRQWDVLTSKFGFAPLVSWRQFLSRAPRDLVVVHLQYRTVADEKAGTVGGNYTEGCQQKLQLAEQLNYLVQYGFKIVREVCVNFESGQQISLSQFNQHILGPYHPGDVSIVMDEWRGFSPQDNRKRVLISDIDTCSAQRGSSIYVRATINLQPSQRIHCEARNYQRMYLGGGHDYISVIVRTEKVRQSAKSEVEMHECLQKTLRRLQTVQKQTNLTSTFLSMDIGKYGSYSSASDFKDFDYSDFIAGIYGRDTSVGMWERTFEKVSSADEAGYVALLQKVLVAEARCLVMVGGGSFQKHAILLHKIFSRRREQTPCIHIVQSCSRNL
jgi:hypothetical protein